MAPSATCSPVRPRARVWRTKPERTTAACEILWLIRSWDAGSCTGPPCPGGAMPSGAIGPAGTTSPVGAPSTVTPSPKAEAGRAPLRMPSPRSPARKRAITALTRRTAAWEIRWLISICSRPTA